MTKFMNKTFSSPANSQAYRDNWDAVFGDDSARADLDQRDPYPSLERCPQCKGLGLLDGVIGVRECSKCRGRGLVERDPPMSDP
jgi:DnaJ-class molecular chaperone